MAQEETEAIRLAAAGATEIGQRPENEDVVVVRDDLQLYLVADGAGGHNAGEVAAALAARSISNYVGATVRATHDRPEFDRFGLAVGARRLATAVHKANRDVFEISTTSDAHRGMGTTVVAASFSPRSGLMHIAHVGDSRCYRMRHQHLELLTWDHSLLADVLEERPELDDAVLEKLPKHVVTRALGMAQRVRVSVRSHAVAAGDRYLLCSDGLTVPVPATEIAAMLRLDKPPGAIVQHLLNAGRDRAGTDNIAVLVIDCTGGPEATVPPERQLRAIDSEPEATRPVQCSGPELLLLGIEEIDVDARPSFHMVPKDSANQGLEEALCALLEKRTPR